MNIGITFKTLKPYSTSSNCKTSFMRPAYTLISELKMTLYKRESLGFLLV